MRRTKTPPVAEQTATTPANAAAGFPRRADAPATRAAKGCALTPRSGAHQGRPSAGQRTAACNDPARGSAQARGMCRAVQQSPSGDEREGANPEQPGRVGTTRRAQAITELAVELVDQQQEPAIEADRPQTTDARSISNNSNSNSNSNIIERSATRLMPIEAARNLSGFRYATD